MSKRQVFTFSGTSGAAASTTAAIGAVKNGFLGFNSFWIHANLLGGTGGTLNLRLQRQVTTDIWSDWVSFPQLAAGAAAISYALSVPDGGSAIAVVGGGSDATPTVVLAANSFVGGHPGNSLRLVGTTGSGNTVGAAQAVYLTCMRF